jgi:GNAT superfamily N-acetyltransferase
VDVVIRPARAHEVAGLPEVERDGDRRYRGYDGVPAGFDDTVAAATLEKAAEEGRLWVAAVTPGTVVDRGANDAGILGFALAEVVDGQAHLAQLSVRFDAQGRGVGRRLVDAVLSWAADGGLDRVTLCTFADVAWNRPLYEHLGFVVLPEERWTPGLRDLFEADGELGLDLSRRVVMVRTVPAP